MTQETRSIQYRFRVRHPSGQELESNVIEVAAPAPPDGNKRPAKTVSERQLKDSRWSENSFEHGDTATMQVKAAGLDGRTVRFVVEHKDAGGWKRHSEHRVPVSGGVAKADVILHHPMLESGAGELNQLGAADLRFYTELED